MFMQKISSTKLISIATTLAALLLVAKLLSLLLWWFLPSEGVELNVKNSYQAKYQRVDFKNMLQKIAVKKEQKKSEQTAYSINSLILKGLYGSRLNGFAIVAKKAAPKKTTIVSVGESYAGYRLKEIYINSVIFVKGGKEYLLKLNSKSSSNISGHVKRVSKKSASSELSEQSVSKKDIEFYSKNPSKIWKDISINPLKENGKIKGFKVTRIKAGSKMAELGLQKGDVIIRANNVKLSSYRDAIKLYNSINTIDTISLVVLRNNQEKEIIYEIH